MVITKWHSQATVDGRISEGGEGVGGLKSNEKMSPFLYFTMFC